MVWEIAEIDVKPGEEAAFEAAAAQAVPLFQRSHGCRGMQIQRSIEIPSRYRLVVEWDHIDDHLVGFRNAPEFQEWRRLVGPHFAEPPRVEHTEKLDLGF